MADEIITLRGTAWQIADAILRAMRANDDGAWISIDVIDGHFEMDEVVELAAKVLDGRAELPPLERDQRT